jgi:hypothetical protein
MKDVQGENQDDRILYASHLDGSSSSSSDNDNDDIDDDAAAVGAAGDDDSINPPFNYHTSLVTSKLVF